MGRARQHVADRVSSIPGVTATVNSEPGGRSNRSPSVAIRWDSQRLGLTGQDVVRILDTTDPRILLGAAGRWRRQTARRRATPACRWCRRPWRRATSESLRTGCIRCSPAAHAASRPNPSGAGRGPVGPLGRRDSVRASTSTHSDSSCRTATASPAATAETTSRDIQGTLNGDRVTLSSNVTERTAIRSCIASPGRSTGDAMSGTLDMGEYLTATWTAKRRSGSARIEHQASSGRGETACANEQETAIEKRRARGGVRGGLAGLARQRRRSDARRQAGGAGGTRRKTLRAFPRRPPACARCADQDDARDEHRGRRGLRCRAQSRLHESVPKPTGRCSSRTSG